MFNAQERQEIKQIMMEVLIENGLLRDEKSTFLYEGNESKIKKFQQLLMLVISG